MKKVKLNIFGDFKFSDVVASSSVVIAMCSFIFTVFLYFDAHEKTKLSVVPNLNISLYFSESERSIKWSVVNNGLGPAKISWFSVTVDGKALSSWSELALWLELVNGDSYSFTNFYPGGLMPLGGDGNLFETKGVTNYHDVLRRAQQVEVQVCYCSIFDDCYISRSTSAANMEFRCEDKSVPQWGPI
ncbi:hypothetical protein D0C17_19195 [Vibrio cholerae]|nr:hypothetical protein [Vibrio cholerae]